MAIINFFKKYPPALLRCTECDFEDEFSHQELRRLAKRQPRNSPCPFQTPCHICHIGFMIPVNYHAPDGKHYLFQNIKPLIKNLDQDTLMERIFTHPDTIATYSFSARGGSASGMKPF